MAQCHKRVTSNATGCGFDCHSRKLNYKYAHFFAMYGISAAMSFAIQHTMPIEFDGKWAACLITRLSLPTPLHAGYSVKPYVYLC